jgi:hypothetical protein
MGYFRDISTFAACTAGPVAALANMQVCVCCFSGVLCRVAALANILVRLCSLAPPPPPLSLSLSLTLSCARARSRVLSQILETEQLVENAATVGAHMYEQLAALMCTHTIIGDVVQILKSTPSPAMCGGDARGWVQVRLHPRYTSVKRDLLQCQK